MVIPRRNREFTALFGTRPETVGDFPHGAIMPER